MAMLCGRRVIPSPARAARCWRLGRAGGRRLAWRAERRMQRSPLARARKRLP